MGLFDILFGKNGNNNENEEDNGLFSQEETCPRCGATMRGDGQRFECPNCSVLFKKGDSFVSPWDDDYDSCSSECESCGQSLAGASLTLPWEDGDNPYAYVTCPHCGYENIKYGYGEDD